MNNFHRQLYFFAGIASTVLVSGIGGWWAGLGWLIFNAAMSLFYAFVCGYIRIGRPHSSS